MALGDTFTGKDAMVEGGAFLVAANTGKAPPAPKPPAAKPPEPKPDLGTGTGTGDTGTVTT